MYRRQHLRFLGVVFILCFFCALPIFVEAKRPPNVDSFIKVINASTTDTDKVNTLLSIAQSYVSVDVGKKFYYANSALNMAEKAKYLKGKMIAEEMIGNCYNEVKRYHDAINFFQQSIDDSKKINRTDVAENCMELMARSYRGLNDQVHMILCQKSALTLAEKIGITDNICRQLRTYSLFLSEAGQYDEAIRWARNDIAYTNTHFINNDKKNRIADLLNIIAGAFIKINGADSSIYFLRTAERLTKETGNDSQRSYILSTFCDVFQSIKMYDSAIIYGEQTVKMGEHFNNLDLQQYYCKTLSQIFEDDHKPVQALYYHKKYDSLMNIINNTQKTVNEAIRLSNINIKQEAERDKQEKKSFEIIKHNQEIALFAALFAMFTFIVLSILIYRNLRLKHKANKIISRQAKDLQEQNKTIQKALKEKEILLKETHHRVKNNLQLIVSLLELQSANLQDEEAKKALYIAQQRVLSIATVHNKLYGNYNVGEIEFSSFVTELFNRLNIAFGNTENPVKFENQILSTTFPLNTVVLLGIILNELITNSFKHAFHENTTGIIKITLTHSEGNYTLQYYDNGTEIPEEVFNNDSGTLGLYLVRRLSKQLKGSAHYIFKGGSIFNIIFPEVGN